MFSSELVIVSVVLLSFFGFFLAPRWLNRHELLPGKNQGKCDKQDSPDDPRLIQRPDDSIKIIRLTNSGEFVDRCELTNALYELNWDREIPAISFGAKKKSDAETRPKLAILYIHGWKHDANATDSDLINFTRLISDLRERHKNQKHVVGIYVGWNASTGLPGILENISFWVKKGNADRIAISAVVTKIVSAIGSVTRGAPDQQDQFIAIGHSFGARILFSATAQSLVYENELAHPGFPGGEYTFVKGIADAVVLLNPTFEASRYTAIDDITRKEERFDASQPPLLLSISTNNDWATKGAFPVGQWLGRARSTRELTTLGNYYPYFTHKLMPVTSDSDIKSDNVHIVQDFTAASLRLTRLTQEESSHIVQPHNPFIVASTTKAVIDGHNGIWAPHFTRWLEELIAALESRNQQQPAI